MYQEIRVDHSVDMDLNMFGEMQDLLSHQIQVTMDITHYYLGIVQVRLLLIKQLRLVQV